MWKVERMKPARIIVPAGRRVEKASARRVVAGRTTVAALHAKSGPGGRVDVIRSRPADMPMPA
jgi:hypothetical protein